MPSSLIHEYVNAIILLEFLQGRCVDSKRTVVTSKIVHLRLTHSGEANALMSNDSIATTEDSQNSENC